MITDVSETLFVVIKILICFAILVLTKEIQFVTNTARSKQTLTIALMHVRHTTLMKS